MQKGYIALFYQISQCYCVVAGDCINATTAKYRAILNQWQDQTIESFVKIWGYRDRTMSLGRNQIAYIS